MSKQTQGSMILVAALAGGFGFVAFVGLMVVGGFSFSPALFLALVVAAAAAIFLFTGFHKANDTPALSVREHRSLTPSSDGKLGNRTVESGTAGLKPGTAGVAAGSDKSAETEAPAIYPAETGRQGAAGLASGAVADVRNAHADSFEGTPFDAGARKADDGTAPGTTAEARPETASEPVAIGSSGTAASSVAGTAASDPSPRENAQVSVDDTIIGTEPARLDGPRDGGADDLKEIRGIGPRLEETLNRMGFYHHDQIAGWTDGEVAWVDENIEGFRGKASRDDWRSQAKDLTAS
ncbi:hypothetical protein [Palleronia sp. LCG004]|uniref:hypothetical protein n=1 Tax=Palleronia sp. LCG004 TaxID=3079304 RepID=UPI0029423FC0|nr:hypothetical protein [Palleronia sp. LCG004]WOI54898.1 hypothetical protein RVY76_07420 [Palleronia sp. LCG004]